MRKTLTLLICSTLIATPLIALTSTSASAETTLITCTNIGTQKTILLKADQRKCRTLLAPAIWHKEQSDSAAHSGAGYANLRTCTSKRAEFNYQIRKSKCAPYQITHDYWRVAAPAGIPTVETASARSYDSAVFTLAATQQNPDAPIVYYLITNVETGQVSKVVPNQYGELRISNLSPLTSYTFTIAAVSAEGVSISSVSTPVITTGAIPPRPARVAAVVYSCADGGSCALGNTGPAGGTIFYVATTPFACGPTRATTCTYLEAAPSGWNTGADPTRRWAQSLPVDYESTAVDNPSAPETAIGTAIGWGYRNTRAIILQGNSDTATSAAALADSYTVTVSGVVYEDWFLPSKDELNLIYQERAAIGGLEALYYWSSSEDVANVAWRQYFNDGAQAGGGKGLSSRVRPVRAF